MTRWGGGGGGVEGGGWRGGGGEVGLKILRGGSENFYTPNQSINQSINQSLFIHEIVSFSLGLPRNRV